MFPEAHGPSEGSLNETEVEEEKAVESETMTQLAVYGDRKQKLKLEKCDVYKQIVSQWQDSVNCQVIRRSLFQIPTTLG